MNSKSFAFLGIIFAIVGGPMAAYGSQQSPYDSGYNHGCDDAGKSEDDKYINEPGKGASHHTENFMDGYDDGYDACSNGEDGDSDGNGGSSSNNEDDTAQRLCNAIDNNRGLATALAIGLGYPGLDAAASALCDITGN